jgi:2-iminoacetate synthase ThiH
MATMYGHVDDNEHGLRHMKTIRDPQMEIIRFYGVRLASYPVVNCHHGEHRNS